MKEPGPIRRTLWFLGGALVPAFALAVGPPASFERWEAWRYFREESAILFPAAWGLPLAMSIRALASGRPRGLLPACVLGAVVSVLLVPVLGPYLLAAVFAGSPQRRALFPILLLLGIAPFTGLWACLDAAVGPAVHPACPGRGRRVFWFLCGVLLPVMCFVFDPVFVVDRNALRLPWRWFELARPGSPESAALYALCGLPILGMAIHALASSGPWRRLTLPAVLTGLVASTFFSAALVPAIGIFAVRGARELDDVLIVLLLLSPGFSPLASLAVYFDALRLELRRCRRPARALGVACAGAAALASLPLLWLAHFRSLSFDLADARRTRDVASAMERLDRYGPMGRSEIGRIFLASGADEQLRMEALSLERRGRSILEDIAAERRRRPWWR